VSYFSTVAKILQDENSFFIATLILTFMAAFLLNYVNKGIGESKNKNVNSYEELKSELDSLKQEFNQLVTNDSKDLNG
ncbi:hypothetical protein, partial [Escherichia coli]